MGIAPNHTMDMTHLYHHHHHRHQHQQQDRGSPYRRYSSCCCCCCLASSKRSRWRFPWRRAVTLLCGATLLSSLLPGAPLARLLLSEDVERHRLMAENEFRLQRSQHFMEQYRASQKRQREGAGAGAGAGAPHSSTKDDSPADVGVTVLTMARGRRMERAVSYRTEYLTQSTATLLRLLNDSSLRLSYTFHVCNIDDKPDEFLEAKALEDVVPVFKRYGGDAAAAAAAAGNGSGSGSQKTKKKARASTLWEKLKKDYVFCMERTLALGVRYVLLVEDDAVAHEDLFHVLEHVLATVVEAPRSRARAPPVAYLKLYHPQRLLGYISLEVERLTELLALSLTLGALLTCWRSFRKGRLHHDLTGGECLRRVPSHSKKEGNVVVRWAGWAAVVAVLALAVGRTNLLELRRLSPRLYQVTPTPSCCIPAVLYSRQGAADFSSFLSNVTCTARRSTDIRMDEFREGVEEEEAEKVGNGEGEWGWWGMGRRKRRGLMLQPNLFSHIGMVSSLRRKEVNPLVVQ
ncbi:GPI-N-acetylgalactosamine transferase PGAP4-like [Babylonia areolata]|uniref:GPI-N-acetylgalactosamine transferase PGAP4-like n=1 Tax=Babylonia areolata TaxID=304850 RepID=UPI003FD308DD